MAITTGITSAKLAPQRYRQQPQGAVEIDWAHPLARGLVFFQIPTSPAAPDLVGNKTATSIGNVSIGTGPHGRCLVSSSTSTDGWSTPYRTDRVQSIGSDFTLSTRLDISGITTHAKLICLPFFSDSWAPPYASIQFGRNSSSTSSVLSVAPPSGSTVLTAVFTNSFSSGFSSGRTDSYIVTKAGSTCRLLYNKTYMVPDSSTLTSDPARFGTGSDVMLMNRTAQSPGEGTAGKMYHAAIWNRALSETEARSFEANPYQILKAPRQRLTFAVETEITSGHALAVLPKFRSTATVVASQIAARTATSASRLPKFGSASAGIASQRNEFTFEFTDEFDIASGIRTSDARGVLPKFSTLAAASRTLGNRTITSAVTLPKLSVTATTTTSISPRTATAQGVLPKFGAGGVLLRSSADRTATSTGALPNFRSTVIAARTVPPSATTSAIALPKFTSLAAAIRTAPPRIGASTNSLPRLRASTATVSLPPPGVVIPLTVNHRRAPSWRLAEAGTGQSRLSFASALDPNGLTYFTIDWATELNGSSDTIILNKDAIGISLSTSAIVAGLMIHAITFDETSVTVWLKIQADQQTAAHWNDNGESYDMNFTVKTINGQIFNRNVAVTVKQM